MENKKGSGVFLGVVSIATLIVAIIGATFAYFSASASSNTDAVNLAAYEFDVKVTNVERIYPTASSLDSLGGLIPLNPTTAVSSTTNLLYALNTAENKCIDSSGYLVCAFYKATIANGGTQPVTLSLEVKTTLNEAAKTAEGNTKDGRTPFEDLAFQAIEGTEGSYTLASGVTAANLQATVGDSTTVTGFSIQVPAGEDAEHYFVVYLNEAMENTAGPEEPEKLEAKDQSSQMGAKYTGQLVYTTSSGDGNKLTGTFNVG